MQAREAGLTAGRHLLAACLALGVAFGARAQETLGSLLYADPVGRGIRLTVVASGLPERMTLRPEEGEVDRLRKLVLALAGADRLPAATVLAETPPAAWTVEGRSGGGLVQAGKVTYWRFQPSQVLPARFTFEGKLWKLQEAHLPARTF